MIIEATEKAVTYRFPGGEILIEQNRPVEVEYQRALKVLEKAKAKVRVVRLSHADWLTAWRDLADVTSGIEPDDHRLPPIMTLLDQCDECYLAGNWIGFRDAASKVHKVVQGAR